MNRSISYNIIDENIGFAGKTVEAFLKSKGYSSQNITDLKKMENNAVIDGQWVHMNSLLKEGDILTINISEEEVSENVVPVEMPLDIVYEDEDIIVVNKPAGLSIHPSLNHYEDTLANGLAYYFEKQGKPFVFRCANRLDKNTTGLVVIGKHMVSAGILSAQVKNREFKREYQAIVKGKILPKEGVINQPIARVNESMIERCVDPEKGERAVTNYQVELEKEIDGEIFSLVRLRLETGRTHQIRVHMKWLGFPLIGDYLYNPDMEKMTRQALHSAKVSFAHPMTGEPLEFTCPLPRDMSFILE